MMKIDIHTDSNDYEYIKSWMSLGYQNEIPGFDIIHNLDISDFTEGRVIVYRIEGNAEAFLTYSRRNRKVKIYLLALNSKFHHKGLGTRFLSAVIDYFRNDDIIVVEAYEPSNKGLRMVNNLKFKMVEDPYENNTWMSLYIGNKYRNKCHTAKRTLALWKGLDTHLNPNACWSLNFKTCKKPIFAYAFKDWTLGIIEDGEIIYSSKVKYFQGLNDEIAYGYIYITEDSFYKTDEGK